MESSNKYSKVCVCVVCVCVFLLICMTYLGKSIWLQFTCMWCHKFIEKHVVWNERMNKNYKQVQAADGPTLWLNQHPPTWYDRRRTSPACSQAGMTLKQEKKDVFQFKSNTIPPNASLGSCKRSSFD